MIRRRRSSPAALEDDDLLGEILLRLPPMPSSLPRASAVSKRWRGLVTDHGFLRRFHAHHREPTLLGAFLHHPGDKPKFTPILPAPDRIPPPYLDKGARLLSCRHGRFLIIHRERVDVFVCDHTTSSHHRVPILPEFKGRYINGAVLCASRERGHVHGDCHTTLFKVVLLLVYAKNARPLTSVYSSEADTWADLISADVRYHGCFDDYFSTLVGNVLYWSFKYVMKGILGFDLERQILDVIEGPPHMYHSGNHQIIQAEDGAVGLAMMSHHYNNIQMWQRNVNCHGISTWMLWKTIKMHKILGIPPQVEGEKTWLKFILGYVEDTDGIFLYVNGSVYMVQLESMQSRKLGDARNTISYCHSFRSVYGPGDCSFLVLIL
ncbi:hypothetical protein VPH35_133640 [Triticum aestivum]